MSALTFKEPFRSVPSSQFRRAVVGFASTPTIGTTSTSQKQFYAPVAGPMNTASRQFEGNLGWEPRAKTTMSLIDYGTDYHGECLSYATTPTNSAGSGAIGSPYYEHLVNGGGAFNGFPISGDKALVDGGSTLNNTALQNKLYSIASAKPLTWSSVEDLNTPTTATSNSSATSRSSTPATGSWTFNEHSQLIDLVSGKAYDIADDLLAKQKIKPRILPRTLIPAAAAAAPPPPPPATPTSAQFNVRPRRISSSMELSPPLIEDQVPMRLQKIRRDSNATATSETNTTEKSAIEIEKEQKKATLYKTEMCRNWEERGSCRYGVKCQFAHADTELRKVQHHPKYKTEICKTFWVNGTCPYGKRCCFIHNDRDRLLNTKRRNSVDIPKSPIKTSPSGKAKELGKFRSDPHLYESAKEGSAVSSSGASIVRTSPVLQINTEQNEASNENIRAFTDAYFSGQSQTYVLSTSPEIISPTTSFNEEFIPHSPNATSKRERDSELGDDEYDTNEEDDCDSSIVQSNNADTEFLRALLQVIECDDEISDSPVVSTSDNQCRPSRRRASTNSHRMDTKPNNSNRERSLSMNTGVTPSNLQPILGSYRRRLAFFKNLG